MTEPATRQRGFTLLEVMVSLVVFALASIALLDLQRESLRTASGIADRAIAQIVAENRLVALMAGRGTPEPGIHRGETEMAGRSWLWRERIVEAGIAGLRRIEVDVRAEPEGPILARLVTVKDAS